LLEGDPEREIWGFLETRFGVPPEVRASHSLWERGETYWALSVPAAVPKALAELKVVCVGIPLVRKVRHWLKPTTAGLRLLAPWITRNRIHLERSELRDLLSRGEIPWTGDGSEGYVLLETDEGILGCGLLRKGRLFSQIPKSEVAALDLG
jgi:NOL1/NOP2/fmu family ribosome biogenesis protein